MRKDRGIVVRARIKKDGREKTLRKTRKCLRKLYIEKKTRKIV